MRAAVAGGTLGGDLEIALRGVHELRILAHHAILLRGRVLRLTPLAPVLAIPEVAGELERLRCRVRPDVDAAADPLAGAEHYHVALEHPVAARHEPGVRLLLEDEDGVPPRPIDGVVPDHRPVHADEGHG